MKRSGHGDYVSGDVTKTGDKSSVRGVFVVLYVTCNELFIYYS